MPFGLDVKTIIVTVLFMMFVLPWIRSALLNRSSASKTQTAQ